PGQMKLSFLGQKNGLFEVIFSQKNPRYPRRFTRDFSFHFSSSHHPFMADQTDAERNVINQAGADAYDASKLGKLEGLEAVRKKPGMYIGGTDERALHHCVSEVLDNSVDEHLANFCSRIEVNI